MKFGLSKRCQPIGGIGNHQIVFSKGFPQNHQNRLRRQQQLLVKVCLNHRGPRRLFNSMRLTSLCFVSCLAQRDDDCGAWKLNLQPISRQVDVRVNELQPNLRAHLLTERVRFQKNMLALEKKSKIATIHSVITKIFNVSLPQSQRYGLFMHRMQSLNLKSIYRILLYLCIFQNLGFSLS